MGHPSPSHQWDMHRHSLFLSTSPWAREDSISPRFLPKHLYFEDNPHEQGHGSRLRARLIGRDFGDLGACLRHYTSDGTCRSIGYSGYFSTLLLIDKSIV